MEKNIKDIKDLYSINSDKYALVLDPLYMKNTNIIKKSISILGEEYLTNIFFINDKKLLDNNFFKNIKSYPSILCFTKNKEEPDFYLPGVIK